MSMELRDGAENNIYIVERYLNCKCGFSRKIPEGEVVRNHTCPICKYEYMNKLSVIQESL